MKDIFDEILFEVSWKIPTGIINLKDNTHLKLIEEELYKVGFSKDSIFDGMSKLNDIISKKNSILEYDQEIENLRIKNPKTNRMVKISSVMTYKDSDPALYILGRRFVRDYMNKRKLNSVDTNKSSGSANPKDSSVKSNVITDKDSILNSITDAKYSESVKDSAKKTINYIYNVLNSNQMSDIDKSKALQDKNNVNISISTNNKKIYLNSLKSKGSDAHKILNSNTESTERLISKLSNYINIDNLNLGISKKLNSLSMPDFNNSIVQYNNKLNNSNSDVNNIFSNSPFNRIDTPKLKSVYAIKDSNNNVIPQNSKNSKKYLEFSVYKNKTLDNLINSKLLNVNMITLIKAHKSRMTSIATNFNSPSKEIATMINNSYSKLFNDLMKNNSDLAPFILKQLSRLQLNDYNIAMGKRSYMPNNNLFSILDNIHIDNKNSIKGDKISLISIKYNNTEDNYALLSNSTMLQKIHPDSTKRNLQGNYVGEIGKTLSIDDSKFLNLSETKQFIYNMLRGSKKGNLLTESEINIIADSVIKYKQRLELIRKQCVINGKIDWKKFNSMILYDSTLFQLNTKMRNIVDKKKLSAIIGRKNSDIAFKVNSNANSNFTIPVLLSGIILSNQIQTSNGYDDVFSTKQYYSNDKLKTVKNKPTTNMNEWYINFKLDKSSTNFNEGTKLAYIGPELNDKYIKYNSINGLDSD